MATDTSTLRELEPRALWNAFADLNAVPRPSKKEDRVIEFARNYGEQLGLSTQIDAVGNVVIRKPAFPGRESATPVILQAHLDMVCQKNAGTVFDFETRGIEMEVEGDWVHARGTTLGADNGIGVAAAMAVLAAHDIAHPPLEALFTIDEETGMTGAKGLAEDLLQGRILLNLDTEDDRELTIGCAGGVDVGITLEYSPDRLPAALRAFELVVAGLKGGHSGMDIHLGRANANKLMNDLLRHAAGQFGLRIGSIDGGGLRNAIPRESRAVVAVPADRVDAFHDWFHRERDRRLAEIATTDPAARIECRPMTVEALLPQDFQDRLLNALHECPHGVYRMSPEIPDLVQTSNNLARVGVADGAVEIGCLTRSSVDAERDELADQIRAIFESIGARVTLSGDYPGWQPVPDSGIVRLMTEIYRERFEEEPIVAACHAGLECGILGSHYPGLEMISFGPNIRGAHSPEERVQISSVQKFWGYLLETLRRIP